MHRLSRLASVGLMCVVLVPKAGAQTLRLERAAAPGLDEFTAAAVIRAELEAEITERTRFLTNTLIDEDQREILRTQIHLRELARDLLRLADDAGPSGSSACLAGFTMAHNRVAIDAHLEQLADAGRLAHFNAEFKPLDERIERGAFTALEAAVADALLPLADALERAGGGGLQSHWIRRERAALPDGSGEPPPYAGSSLAELHAALESGAIRDDIRGVIELLIGFLERGREFPEFRAEIELYEHIVSRAVATACALAGAEWLGDEERTKRLDALHAALQTFRDKTTRAEGMTAIEQICLSAPALRRLTALAEIRRERVDIAPLAEAFRAIEALVIADESRTAGAEQLARFERAIECMIDQRARRSEPLPSGLGTVEAWLHRAYDTAEAALLERAADSFGQAPVLADPAFVSLLHNHAQLVEDMARLHELPQWMEDIRAIDRGAGERFEAQAQKMAAWLIDPARRSEAILAMNQFDDQRARFLQLSIERATEASSLTGAALDADQRALLIEMIERARKNWAVAWGAGDAASEAANRMLLLSRLSEAICDLGAWRAHQDHTNVLRRWPAWELPAGVLGDEAVELDEAVQRAVDATIRADDDELAQQLELMDDRCARVRLAGRILRAIGEELTNLPADGAGAIAQLAAIPPQDAWLVAKRGLIAQVCRYTIEGAHAAQSDRAALRDQCNAYANRLARELLEHLGDRRALYPTLLGFDGS